MSETGFPFPGIQGVFRGSNNDEPGVERTLVLGKQPMILVEPVFVEGTDQILHFNLDVTDLLPNEAADLLAALADTIRAGTVVDEQVPEDTEDRAIASGDLLL